MQTRRIGMRFEGALRAHLDGQPSSPPFSLRPTSGGSIPRLRSFCWPHAHSNSPRAHTSGPQSSAVTSIRKVRKFPSTQMLTPQRGRAMAQLASTELPPRGSGGWAAALMSAIIGKQTPGRQNYNSPRLARCDNLFGQCAIVVDTGCASPRDAADAGAGSRPYTSSAKASCPSATFAVR